MLGITAQGHAAFITAADYCSFLNAVAPSDPHGLYDERMDSIERFGKEGSYHYSVYEAQSTLPLCHLSWLDAARYCNWQDASLEWEKGDTEQRLERNFLTEHGTYELNDLQVVYVDPEASYFIEDNPVVDTSLKSPSGTFSIVSTSQQIELFGKNSLTEESTSSKKQQLFNLSYYA